MTSHPDISIIIPAFNRLWCLPAAVASCRQSSARKEIIVVDDGSTDGTWEWLQRQPDVTAIKQTNWGKDHAVNRGFELARGEFVRFLDSDDLVTPGADAAQLDVARKTGADVVVAGHVFRDDVAGTQLTRPWTPCDDFVSQQLGECDSSHYSAYLFRREFLKGVRHRQEFGVRDDRMFVIEMAIKGPRVASVDIPCLIHIHHARQRLQFSKGLQDAVTNWAHLQIYKKAALLLEERGALTVRRRKAMAKALWPLAHWIAKTHLSDAKSVADWIFTLDPEFVVPEKGMLGWMYRIWGFKKTERILRLRRFLLQPFRASSMAEA